MTFTAKGLNPTAATTTGTRATVDGDWKGVTTVAIQIGSEVKAYRVNPSADNLTVTTSQINNLMENDIPRLTDKLNHISDNFVTISDNLAQTDYDAMLRRVDATLANISTVTDKLNSRDNNLGLLLNDTTLYHNLNRTTSGAATLLEDLKAHPKRYVHFSLFGRKDK